MTKRSADQGCDGGEHDSPWHLSTRTRPLAHQLRMIPVQTWCEVKPMALLRELRAERLLSIRDLARRALVAPSTIFLIESGRTIPRQRVARQIAEVLGVEPAEVDELRRSIEVIKSRRGGTMQQTPDADDEARAGPGPADPPT